MSRSHVVAFVLLALCEQNIIQVFWKTQITVEKKEAFYAVCKVA